MGLANPPEVASEGKHLPLGPALLLRGVGAQVWGGEPPYPGVTNPPLPVTGVGVVGLSCQAARKVVVDEVAHLGTHIPRVDRPPVV